MYIDTCIDSISMPMYMHMTCVYINDYLCCIINIIDIFQTYIYIYVYIYISCTCHGYHCYIRATRSFQHRLRWIRRVRPERVGLHILVPWVPPKPGVHHTVDGRHPANQLNIWYIFPLFRGFHDVSYKSGGWPWDFWTINSSTLPGWCEFPKSPKNGTVATWRR